MGYILRRWREILIVILAGVCYYLYSRPDKIVSVPVPTVKTEYITKTKHEKEFIRVTEPSGRIVEKTIERGETTTDKSRVKETPKVADKDRYEVGTSYAPKEKTWQIDAAYRIGNSPISVTAGYQFDPQQPRNGSATIGARVSW